MQLLLRDKGIEFISLVRRGPRGADLSINANGIYRILRVSADGATSVQERDDHLYDQIVGHIEKLEQ